MRLALLPLVVLLACNARPPGDPERGWEVLRYGGYVGAGIPEEVWFNLMAGFGDDAPPENLLERDGASAALPPSFNLFESPEGASVVGGITCFGCHGGMLNGVFVPGLGNAGSDYATGRDDAALYGLIRDRVRDRYGGGSPEALATERLVRGAEAVGEAMKTPFRGVNPAFGIEWAAAGHRDPETLAWGAEPAFSPPPTLPASDVPPWWNVRKKERLYYNGVGRGDFARLMTQISVVAVRDAEHLQAIDAEFADVRAYIEALRPPVYPGEVDVEAVALGAQIFDLHCAECHGTYGPDGVYPSKVVPLDEVGTDPAYARAFLDDPRFVDWLRESAWAEGPWAAVFEPEAGYVAPPLDGVWATAPYLHNGSVPDLYALLDSGTRPAAWWRDFSDSTYDLDRVGWPWEVREPGTGEPTVYDTTLPGYGNGGHTFGDDLSAAQRDAVIAYLTTL